MLLEERYYVEDAHDDRDEVEPKPSEDVVTHNLNRVIIPPDALGR